MTEPRFRFRLYVLTASVMVGFGALLSRLHDFQINRREEFLKQVPGNRTVSIREPGIRGEIIDRNGIALATNTREYEVSFNLQEIYAAYRRQHLDDPKLDRLTTEGGMMRKRTEKDIVSVVNQFIIPRLVEKKLAKNYNAGALRAHFLTHGGLVPFSYRADLTYDEFARFAEMNLELPGVYLDSKPERVYPYGTLASHVLGYLKQWEKGDIPEDARRRFDHYIGEDKGQAGIEATMDQILRGPEGEKKMLKDEKGGIMGMLGYTRPAAGAKIELTLDARVQYLAENTLRHVGRAACVVMEVETGEILAMASVPDYNPNLFIPSIEPKQFSAYNTNRSHPFNNRCISAYTPGSTFKIGTALSGAVKGVATRVFSCDGYVAYGNAKVGCWIWNQHKGNHGSETLPIAIKQSCNPYFNKMANTIGAKAMVDGFTMLGFGKPTGVPLPGESPGVILGNRAWRASHAGRSLTPHDIALFSIGQSVTATPLQLCAMVSTVANGGKYYQPRLVKKATAVDGTVLIPDKPKLEVDLLKEGVKDSDLELIRKGMWMAVNEPGGTAGRAKLPDIQIAAKTGTAQVSLALKTHNSWMIAFAPFEKPKYAICVLVEDGKSGGKVCGPLVQHIIRGLIARDNGMKLALQPQTEYGGHRDPIEEVAPLEDLPATEPIADAGETGDEVESTTLPPISPETENDKPPVAAPTLTPEVDDEGTVIPRAKPVENP
jgi:penicillin-binding protein 2